MEAMDHDDPYSEPTEITTFYPDSVELIDPREPTRRVMPVQYQRPLRSRKGLILFLFIATCISTFVCGFTPGAGLDAAQSYMIRSLQPNPPAMLPTTATLLMNGLQYGGAVMLILLAHEMGHYSLARIHRVPATLPYFIPFPFNPFGTMGAVIVQGAGSADRKSLFDIAIAGPLAGLVIALPVTYWGLLNATIMEIPAGMGGVRYGDPLLLQWMAEFIHGPLGKNQDVALNPLLFAGWVGIFITALNLIPIGQLDGGHILYTLVGKRAHTIALLLLGGAVFYMIYENYLAYLLIVILLLVMGPRHPPTADDTVPIGWPRILLGWLTLAFIVIGFTPKPIMLVGG